MRSSSTHLAVLAAGVLAAISTANELPAQQPSDSRADGSLIGALKAGLNGRPPGGPEDDAELAGLPKGSRPEVLTWERAYTLALVASRDARPAQGARLAEALDPEELAGRAKRFGVADFARFREEFFKGGMVGSKAEGKFRDPSFGFIELLWQLQTIENARKNVAAQEGQVGLIKELFSGETSGLRQIDIDQMDSSLQQARSLLSDEILRYRDRLDAFKLDLGLSPQAPVVIDRGSLAAFRAVFDQVDRWTSDPNRSLQDLPGLVERLPSPGVLVIDGRSFLGSVDDDPDLLANLLSLGVRVAIKNRAARGEVAGPEDPAGQLELRVRRRIRYLLQTRRAYEDETRRLLITIDLKDTAFERMIAPPSNGPPQGTAIADTTGLFEHQSRLLLIQNQLVVLWTSFRAERLALYRDLGAMPFEDWNSFYRQFTAELGRPTRVPIVPQGKSAPPAPAPPAPR